MNGRLYFVAFILPEPLRSRIYNIKIYLKEKFGVQHALNSPAHITLIPPWTIKMEDEIDTLEQLKKTSLSLTPFDLEIFGYKGFKYRERRVLYLNPVTPSFEAWQSLHHGFLEVWNGDEVKGKGKNKKFIPHITLAHRDLTVQVYENILNSLPSFHDHCRIDRTGLLRHNGSQKEWEVIEEVRVG